MQNEVWHWKLSEGQLSPSRYKRLARLPVALSNIRKLIIISKEATETEPGGFRATLLCSDPRTFSPGAGWVRPGSEALRGYKECYGGEGPEQTLGDAEPM